MSREFSVATLNFSVDAGADPDRVTALLRRVAQDVRNDAAFAEVVMADPEVPGVDRIAGREVIYPVNVRVKANQKDGVLRELRKRLLKVFEKEGIALGLPASVVVDAGKLAVHVGAQVDDSSVEVGAQTGHARG